MENSGDQSNIFAGILNPESSHKTPLMEDVSLGNGNSDIKNGENEKNEPVIKASEEDSSKAINSSLFLSASEKIPQVTPTVMHQENLSREGNMKLKLTLDDPVVNAIERNSAINDCPHITIRVVEPQKVGEGIGAYVIYKLITRVHNVSGIHQAEGEEWHVLRRFSDFLGLYEKLVAKYSHLGYIIPPPPEKSLIGMTKLKISSKDDNFSADFAERRRASLERYVNRSANHPVLMRDPTLHEFLQADGELPRAVGTSALSTNHVMKLINRVSDLANRVGFRMDESDHWFEDMQNQIENLDSQMRKLHASVEALVHHRKELSNNTAAFSKSLAMLGNAEEHTALSRVLSQLAEVEERLEQITGSDVLNLNPSVPVDQFGSNTGSLMVGMAHNDYFVLSEILKDYIGLIGAVKEAFEHRVRAYQNLSWAEASLSKKRKEAEAKSLSTSTTSVANDPTSLKMSQLKGEIKELEDRVNFAHKDFEMISANIRKEIGRFEKERIREFKDTFILYLENLLKAQQQIVKCWEAFLPEARVIS